MKSYDQYLREFPFDSHYSQMTSLNFIIRFNPRTQLASYYLIFSDDLFIRVHISKEFIRSQYSHVIGGHINMANFVIFKSGIGP